KIEVSRGEVIAIVGSTGAGKSQLLYDIEKLAQRDTKSKRQILVNDQVPDRNWRFNPERKLIASLAQTMNFLTDMSVGDFLKLHLESRGKKGDEGLIKEVIQEANEITGEPISSEMNLLNLSGGQSRALMISDVANISVSPIILIDEIENAGIKKEKAIQILLEEGKIVLIVTHDPSLALNSDRRIVVKNGGIVDMIKTTSKEKNIAEYLNWIEGYNLDVREKIRKGEKIETVDIYCRPAKPNDDYKLAISN
ncbi:MAG TPA: ATP-binding cassette domain-containing protein, partial [Candidatus Portnoybacteria bacterium]|nr:ATP-binding cassette domain-containing protein [Candidatus Portnoybacteria bacterium]